MQEKYPVAAKFMAKTDCCGMAAVAGGGFVYAAGCF